MFKKLFLVAVLGTIGFAAVKSSKYFGYAKHEVAEFGEWVDSKVPPEKKIASLRKEVRSLDKDIARAGDELAREIVDVNDLTKDVVAMRTDLGAEEKKVRAMATKLSDATEKIVAYGRFNVSVDEAKMMLNSDVKRVVSRKATLDSMEQTLAHRERIKDALSKQLDSLKRNKLEMAVAIDKLEAEYKVLALQQTESKYQIDDSRLAHVKERLRDLQKEVDVKREKLKLAPRVMDESAPASALSVSEILAPLDNAPKADPKPEKVDSTLED